jgi:hypothetical protein
MNETPQICEKGYRDFLIFAVGPQEAVPGSRIAGEVNKIAPAKKHAREVPVHARFCALRSMLEPGYEKHYALTGRGYRDVLKDPRYVAERLLEDSANDADPDGGRRLFRHFGERPQHPRGMGPMA